MALELKAPFSLKADIERGHTPNEVVAQGKRLAEAVGTLVEANVDPVDVGHVVAVIVDALTRRLLELGIREHGDPPCPWSWLALGSEARQEQALLTDQDNAMVIDPGRAARGGRFLLRAARRLRQPAPRAQRHPSVQGRRDRLQRRMAEHPRGVGGAIPTMDGGGRHGSPAPWCDLVRLPGGRRAARDRAGLRPPDQACGRQGSSSSASARRRSRPDHRRVSSATR